MANIWTMSLAMMRADPLFKLRLPAFLRRQLEQAAMASGRTLTGEILQRLEESFPSLPERVAILEAHVADPTKGLEALLARIEELERKLEEARKSG